MVALGEDRFLGIAYGTFGQRGDEAFVVDASSGEAKSLYSAASAFALGTAAFSPETGQLVLPDASDGGAGLRLYAAGPDGELEAGEVLTFNDGPLPPRIVRRLAGETAP